MSWWGGGEMSPTPGVVWRTQPMYLSTLWPGSWPPSPGLAPCAILICSWSALTREWIRTPERPPPTRFDAAEPARRPLLDRAAAVVGEAPRVLPALAGVRLAAQVVHRLRERLVGLRRDRPERHRAGGEAPDDLLGRLDLLEGHLGLRAEAQL